MPPACGNGGIQIRDVVEGIKGGYRRPDGAVKIQLEQILPEQQQTAGKSQLLGLIPHHAEHLLRLIDADHIVACLRQHQGQFPGAAAKVGYNAVMDAVGFQLCMDLPGYGYAKVSNADRERWDDLINSYFEAPRHHTLLVQLLDCRHAPSADDLQMLRYLHYHRTTF